MCMQVDAALQQLRKEFPGGVVDGRSGLYGLDATHGLCDSGHVLYTLLRIGEDWSGVPVLRFFLPANHEAAHLEAVFYWLLEQVPTFSPYFIMSDDDRKGTFLKKTHI